MINEKKLWDFQTHGVNYLTSRYSALLADEMGTGKTVQASRAIQHVVLNSVNCSYRDSHLVVCPASIKYSWSREFISWTERTYIEPFIVRTGSEILPKYPALIIVNPELLLNDNVFGQLKERKYLTCTADEAHYYKSMEAARTKRMLAEGGIVRNAVYRWMLTGTPMLNYPIELYPILATLAAKYMGEYVDYSKYIVRYCNPKRNAYGEMDLRGACNLEELGARLRGFMLRREKKDVLPDLPPKIIKYTYIDPVAFAPEFKRVVKDFIEEQKAAGVDDVNMGNEATVRRLTALAKVKFVEQRIEDMQAAGASKLLVFGFHKCLVRRLKERHKGYSVCIDGEMSAEKKDKLKTEFIKHDGSGILFGNMKSAGFGLDGLQKVTNQILFAEPAWSPGETDQCIDRLHRAGIMACDGVYVEIMLVPDTVETRMDATAKIKRKHIGVVVNG